MSVQITEQDFYDMRQERDNARTMVIDADIRIAEQAATIARLTADAKLNDMAWTDNQAALKAQAAEIERLTEKVRYAYVLKHWSVQILAAPQIYSTTPSIIVTIPPELKSAIEDIKYYVGNPSAWEYYDDGVSEKIRAILKAAGMA